jgi:hypothetical protein
VIELSQVESALATLQDTETHAVARAQVRYLQEYGKVILAEGLLGQRGSTVSEREACAKTTKEYREHLELLRDVMKDDAKYSFEREAAKALIEAWRTQEASHRAEGKAY